MPSGRARGDPRGCRGPDDPALTRFASARWPDGRAAALDVGALWALQIYRNKQVFGSAPDRYRQAAPGAVQVLEPTFGRLTATGYVLQTGDELWLTQSGMRQVDAVSAAIVGRIHRKLDGAAGFQGARPGAGGGCVGTDRASPAGAAWVGSRRDAGKPGAGRAIPGQVWTR